MTETTTPENPLWDYIYYTDYQVPSAPLLQKVNGWWKLIQHLRATFNLQSSARFEQDIQLERLSPQVLQRVVPPIDWQNASTDLTTHLHQWLENAHERSVVVVVLPPFTDQGKLLSEWAQSHDWQVLTPPTIEQVLQDDRTWLETLKSNDKLWVLPNLEKCYLRHPQGLEIVRRLLDAAYSGEYGQGLIGCDSWAWMFLRYVWQGRTPIVLTLQAFDADKIQTYLQSRWTKRPIAIRDAFTLDLVTHSTTFDTEGTSTNNFLQYLAAYSRGNLGVALALLRLHISDKPEEVIANDAELEEMTTPNTYWLKSWYELTKPSMPANAGHNEAMVLHNLLLHSGMTFKCLELTLPLTSPQMASILVHLEQADLVERSGKYWQITPQGYPAAREFLQSLNYLVDAF